MTAIESAFACPSLSLAMTFSAVKGPATTKYIPTTCTYHYTINNNKILAKGRLVLALALALVLLLCIRFLGAWQQCVHYNKKQQCIQCRHNIWCNTSKHLVGLQGFCSSWASTDESSVWTCCWELSNEPQQRWTLAVPEQTEQINKHTQNTTNNNPNLRQCDVQKPHAHQTSVGAWKKCTHQAPFAMISPWLPAQCFFVGAVPVCIFSVLCFFLLVWWKGVHRKFLQNLEQ